MLKRLLGVILAVSMALSLLPVTVFAAGEVDKSNLKLTYAIVGSSGSEYYTNVVDGKYEGTSSKGTQVNLNDARFKDYCATNGMWRFVGVHPDAANVSTYKTGGKTASTQWCIYARQGEWVAIGFHVPVAGTYDLTINIPNSNDRCRFAYKILPGGTGTSEITASMSDVVWDAENKTSGSALGWLYPANDANGSRKNSETKNGLLFPEAGEYIMVVKNIAYSASVTDTAAASLSNNNIWISKFELVTSNGTGETEAPLGYTMLDDTSIGVGEDTTASISTLYGSVNFGVYNPTAITYTSSDTSVATVDANGVVKGESEGTAEITAIVDGATLVSVSINVTQPPQVDKFLSFVYTPRELEGNTNFGAVIDYSLTNGLWVFNGMSPESEEDVAPYSAGGKIHKDADSWVAYVKEGRWIAFELNVPKAGTYYVDVTTLCSPGRPHVAYKILEGGISQSEIDSAMANVIVNEDVTGALNADGYLDTNNGKSPCRFEKTFEKPGKYIFVAKNIKYSGDVNPEEDINYTSTANIRIVSIALTSTTKTDDASAPVGYVSLGKKKLLIGEKTTATVSEKLYDSVNWDEYTAKEITFVSSNNEIATVDAATGAVEAKAEGTVEIAAIADGYQLTSATLTVEKYESAPETLSLWVGSDADGDVSVTVNEAPVPAGEVAAAAQGATVKVTAKDTETHRFSHWLGTAGVASFDKEYTFNIYTNTALKAVYEAIPDENQVMVSFYKPNRELFATEVVEKNTTFSEIELDTNNLSLVGYTTFKGWALGEDENEDPIMVADDYVITGDLGVVAVFDDETTVKNFKVGSNVAEDVLYGTEFEEYSNANYFTYWMRNSNIVSYNKKYTFYAWQDNAKIEAKAVGAVSAEPIALLEEYDEDTWMFEYEIPANCERLEAGIIFGNSNDITIDSCYARAVSRRGAEDKHGQFTASSEYPNAKGYIIFKDSNNKTRVVYSK